MKEAIKCLETGTYRSSHVAAWAAFMGYVEEKLGEDGYVELDRVRGWKVTNPDELIEAASDYVILGCLKDVGIITKSTLNSLRGLLAKRNECAHPSEYEPGLNDTLGYISELVRRIEYLQSRNISH